LRPSLRCFVPTRLQRAERAPGSAAAVLSQIDHRIRLTSTSLILVTYRPDSVRSFHRSARRFRRTGYP
jgi:hypothetical protein